MSTFTSKSCPPYWWPRYFRVAHAAEGVSGVTNDGIRTIELKVKSQLLYHVGYMRPYSRITTSHKSKMITFKVDWIGILYHFTSNWHKPRIFKYAFQFYVTLKLNYSYEYLTLQHKMESNWKQFLICIFLYSIISHFALTEIS